MLPRNAISQDCSHITSHKTPLNRHLLLAKVIRLDLNGYVFYSESDFHGFSRQPQNLRALSGSRHSRMRAQGFHPRGDRPDMQIMNPLNMLN